MSALRCVIASRWSGDMDVHVCVGGQVRAALAEGLKKAEDELAAAEARHKAAVTALASEHQRSVSEMQASIDKV